jgi:hypothetical protein
MSASREVISRIWDYALEQAHDHAAKRMIRTHVWGFRLEKARIEGKRVAEGSRT